MEQTKTGFISQAITVAYNPHGCVYIDSVSKGNKAVADSQKDTTT